jgi:hypothetical protein
MKRKRHTTGLDLSDRKVASGILGAEGQVLQELSQPNTRETYLRLASEHPGATAIHEPDSQPPWVSHCAGQGFRLRSLSVFVNCAKSELV